MVPASAATLLLGRRLRRQRWRLRKDKCMTSATVTRAGSHAAEREPAGQRAGRPAGTGRAKAGFPRKHPHRRRVADPPPGRRAHDRRRRPSRRQRSTRSRSSLAQKLAAGEAIIGVTLRLVDGINATHAAEFASVTSEAALDLLRRNSEAAAAAIRALSDEELNRAAPLSLNADAPLTCQFMLEDHAVRHSYHHLARIRAALKSPFSPDSGRGRPPRRPGVRKDEVYDVLYRAIPRSSGRLHSVKARQQAMWASGDFAVIGTTLQIVGELLCEGVDLRRRARARCGRGQRQRDACGSPSLCQRHVHRLRAGASGARSSSRRRGGPRRHLRGGRRRGTAVSGREFRRGALDLRRHVRPDHEQAASELMRVCRPRGRIGLASWTPPGFLGQLFLCRRMFRRCRGFALPFCGGPTRTCGICSPGATGIAIHADDLLSVIGRRSTWSTVSDLTTGPSQGVSRLGRGRSVTTRSRSHRAPSLAQPRRRSGPRGAAWGSTWKTVYHKVNGSARKAAVGRR